MGEEEFLAAAMGMRSKLYHVAISILWNEQDAADAVQEAMLKGWKRRGTLRDEALFEAWFTRILVNQCRDAQRRRRKPRNGSVASSCASMASLNSFWPWKNLGSLSRPM